MNTLVLGLDMGTTSISAVAVDASGRVVQSATTAHRAAVDGLSTERAEQAPEKVLNAVLQTVRDLTGNIGTAHVAGIGLTGQMHSTVILDRDRDAIGNVITWQDRRSLSQTSRGTLLSELQARATEEAMLPTGCRLSPGYLGTTLFALRRLHQLDENVFSVSFVADWIGSCLAATAPVTDRSHAASSGMYDLVADHWSDQLLEAAEVPREWLPKVVESGSLIGQVCRPIADRTGLSQGLPVFNAIGDNQASVLSVLPDSPGSLLINIGTGGQIVWRIPQFARQLPLDTRVLPGSPGKDACTSKPQFMIVGAGLSGGDAIAWVNRTVRSWLSDFGITITEDDVWRQLSAQAASPNTSEELSCEPFFRGTRYEPDRRGLLRGIGLDNLTPANLLASVLDGIAQSMFDVWQSSPTSAKTTLHRVAMSGNAVKHNRLLVDAVQRRFRVPVEVAQHSEEAATGAAMLAGVHLGIWNSLENARRCVRDAAESCA